MGQMRPHVRPGTAQGPQQKGRHREVAVMQVHGSCWLSEETLYLQHECLHLLHLSEP